MSLAMVAARYQADARPDLALATGYDRPADPPIQRTAALEKLAARHRLLRRGQL